MGALQIKTALELCSTKCDWPPSPAEFRKLCEKPIDYERMFIAAANALSTKNWPDKLTYWSACSVGRYDLQRLSYSQAKARWQNAVDSMLADEPLPDIPKAELKALPAPGETMNRDIAHRELAKSLAILRAKQNRFEFPLNEIEVKTA